jgi:hypothetical protein
LFLPHGVDEVVTVDDCMLVARPMAIQQRARQALIRDANVPLEIKRQEIGHGIPVPGGSHKTATAGNKINVTMERVEIPE